MMFGPFFTFVSGALFLGLLVEECLDDLSQRGRRKKLLMPIFFMRKPLGAIITGGENGLKLAVMARPCDLRPRPVQLGTSLRAALCKLSSGPQTVRQMVGDDVEPRPNGEARACTTMRERCNALRDFGFAALDEGGFWSLTPAGRQWLEAPPAPPDFEPRVLAALRAGFRRCASIAEATGLSEHVTTNVLNTMARHGRAWYSRPNLAWYLAGEQPAKQRRKAAAAARPQTESP